MPSHLSSDGARSSILHNFLQWDVTRRANESGSVQEVRKRSAWRQAFFDRCIGDRQSRVEQILFRL
jgi:hypothetical protein